jgi:cell division protein ZapB
MDASLTREEAALDLARLEGQVERLLSMCERLRGENKVLRERQASLLAERARLMEKNSVARTRVESIIARLQGLESDA